MGQKLAAYDSNGNIIAYYDTVDSPAPEGVDTIDITDAQWAECTSTPGYTVKNGELVAPTPPTASQSLASLKATLCAQIDAVADQMYIAIGGPSPGRLAEYQQAGDDASAFKATGYSGSVPITVSCWAQANPGWTNQQAADDIIATAAKWMTALQNIRSARLLGKAAVNAAATTDAAQTAGEQAVQNVQSGGAVA